MSNTGTCDPAVPATRSALRAGIAAHRFINDPLVTASIWRYSTKVRVVTLINLQKFRKVS